MKPIFFYNHALKYIQTKLGNKITFGSKLTEFGKHLFGNKYIGTFAVDKLPDIKDKNFLSIINVDTSQMAGSHWLAAAKKGKYLYIYDSFGRSGKSQALKKAFKILSNKYGYIIESEYDPEQKSLETNCGQRSLAWLFVFHTLGPSEAVKI